MLVFGLLLIIGGLVVADPSEKCGSVEAQNSCGQCIAAHPDCGWCTNPNAPVVNRCQLRTFFKNETCEDRFVYSPKPSEVEVKGNVPLEAKELDGVSIVRIQPQTTVVRLKKGHSGNVTLKYLHIVDPSRPSGNDQMQILTSDISAHPIKARFFVLCEGVLTETKTCKVQNNQIVEVIVEITLIDCFSGGDIGVSVGFSGVRTVSGIYVSSVCRCDCERNTQMNSPFCNQHGHMVCGKCICQKQRGGNKCECPLSLHGVSTPEELDNKCRFNSSSAICSNNGNCNCGQCACTSPTISGKFCQCDNASCPKAADGRMCSGNGVCNCGVCQCQLGWERDDCSCSTANNNCVENGATDIITQVTPVDPVSDLKEGAGHDEKEDEDDKEIPEDAETSGSPLEASESKTSTSLTIFISTFIVFFTNLFF
ncbi:unnamed protein product [Caenorhabditis angaria]|uniref:Integrin beta subunit VWA domain-containing protein n=1 Tax=Caenorhabditis angaria TaxID=860376 RepID=A0A9P1J0Y4_9PELO|nr:unnamed protein product [Caenorhabditis angaria]